MTTDINNINPVLLEEDDRIVAYLKGQMSAEEEQQFIKEVEENKELREKAIVTARLVKGLKQVGMRQDKDIIDALLVSSENEVEQAARNVAKPRKASILSIHKPSIWLSIAASLIFVVWLGLEYNDYRSTTGLGNQYGNSAFTAEMISRGAGSLSEADKKLENLFNEVKDNRNIDGAIHELSLCWELSTMETYNDYTDYSAEIGWNLAIAYLKDNNRRDALTVLSKMAILYDADTVVGKQVRELQQKIKDL